MPTNTYVALQTSTLSSSASNVTFSSIPQGYTDLVLVATVLSADTTTKYLTLQFNSDTASNYSNTIVAGNGTAASSARDTSVTEMYLTPFGGMLNQTTNPVPTIINIQNYSNTNTNKTVLYRANQAGSNVLAGVGLYRSTAAISAVKIFVTAGNMAAGSTFSLYGIKAEPFAAKATGGTIAYANGYWTHTFTSSGTFTPTQALSCDYLVVAGGGGGGPGIVNNTEGGGGGGGGGFRTSIGGSPLSVAATAYSITVGAAGAGSTSSTVAGGSGTNSVFSTISATGGGGGGCAGAHSTPLIASAALVGAQPPPRNSTGDGDNTVEPPRAASCAPLPQSLSAHATSKVPPGWAAVGDGQPAIGGMAAAASR
jgi:hypothetical protein